MLGTYKLILSLLMCKLNKCVLILIFPVFCKGEPYTPTFTSLYSLPRNHFYFLFKQNLLKVGMVTVLALKIWWKLFGPLKEKACAQTPTHLHYHFLRLRPYSPNRSHCSVPLPSCLCLDFCTLHALSSSPKFFFPQRPAEMSYFLNLSLFYSIFKYPLL